MTIEKNDITQMLVEQALSGNQQASYKLYKLHVQAMYNTCFRIVDNKLDAEDILQESFASAFCNLEKFKGEVSFGAWLKQIVINKSINFVRNRKNWLVITDNLPETEDELDDIDVSEDNTINNILPEMIFEAIKSLPEKAKIVFSLYLLEGYQHKDISRMMDISESTSKSQYQRARKLLQDILLNMIIKKTV